jgi:hypothetical protein
MISDKEVRKIIAEKRNLKAKDMAFLAFRHEITAEQLSGANDQQWGELVRATGRDRAVPSEETQALVISKLLKLERRKSVAA